MEEIDFSKESQTKYRLEGLNWNLSIVFLVTVTDVKNNATK
jgi:hypothetical protein